MALGAETILDRGEGFYPSFVMEQAMLFHPLRGGEKGLVITPVVPCAEKFEQSWEVVL